MPWSKENYPNTFKNFDSEVKNKAIEIANALLDDGYEESRAIPIAAKQAQQWAENSKENNIKRHIIPTENGWGIKKENGDRLIETFEKKENAKKRGREIARNQNATLVIHDKEGKISEQVSY